MDYVLLGFCLFSLVITSLIVFLDLSRRGEKKLEIPETDLPEFEDNLIIKEERVEKSLDFFEQGHSEINESKSDVPENSVHHLSELSETAPEIDFEKMDEEEKPFYEEIKAEEPKPDFLRQRIESVLQQQLNQLGYTSVEQQLDFVKNVLTEPKESISSLNPAELRGLLNRIIELRENPESPAISRSA